MAAQQFFVPFPTAFNSNGLAVPGAKAFFYLPGTSTLTTVYSNDALTVSAANPVVANGAGRFPTVYLNNALSYRLRLEDADGVELDDIDPYVPGTLIGATSSETFTQSGSGAVARTVVAKLRDEVSILDFIPVAEHAAILAGTSTYDSAPGLRAAVATGRKVKLPTTGRAYLSSTTSAGGLSVYADFTNSPGMCGEGSNGALTAATKLYGQVPTDAMFYVGTNKTHFSDFLLDSAYRSKFGFYMNGANSSVFERLTVTAFNRDGFHFPLFGNNSNCIIRDNYIKQCGATYSTGTATNAANSNVVNFTGAADLTTVGIRPELDMYRPTASGRYYSILTVSATSITLADPIVAANTSVPYAILMGSGICIDRHGDNSKILITGNTFQANVVAGIRNNPLYGAIARDNDYMGNGHSHVIGTPNHTIESPIELDGYHESSASGYHVMVERAINGQIRLGSGPLFGGLALTLVPNNSDARINGLVIQNAGFRLDRKISEAINSATIELDPANAYFVQQSSGASNQVLNLPGYSGVLSQYTLPIVVTFMGTGGKTFTFKSATTNVNGVAGTTGFVHTGDYAVRTCRFSPTYGWIVT